jgi:hypothetical protein
MATKQEIEDLATLKTEVTHIKEDIGELKTSVGSLDKKFDAVIDKMEKRYASKWVEKAIIGVVVFVLTSVGGLVMTHALTPEPLTPTTVQVNK